jgi:hypothetical protein
MSQAKITTSLSRRSVLAGVSVAVAPMAAGAGLSGDDAELRRLWAEYLAARAAEASEESNMRNTSAVFDALMPPCPHNVLPGAHWESPPVQSLRKSTGADAAYDRWQAAAYATEDVFDRIQRTPAQGLLGIGVKLAPLSFDLDPEDHEEAVSAALACINRLTGSNFPVTDFEPRKEERREAWRRYFAGEAYEED